MANLSSCLVAWLSVCAARRHHATPRPAGAPGRLTTIAEARQRPECSQGMVLKVVHRVDVAVGEPILLTAPPSAANRQSGNRPRTAGSNTGDTRSRR